MAEVDVRAFRAFSPMIWRILKGNGSEAIKLVGMICLLSSHTARRRENKLPQNDYTPSLTGRFSTQNLKSLRNRGQISYQSSTNPGWISLQTPYMLRTSELPTRNSNETDFHGLQGYESQLWAQSKCFACNRHSDQIKHERFARRQVAGWSE